MTNAQTEARAIARSVRGCTTDYQYIELVDRIATALAARDEELEKVKRKLIEVRAAHQTYVGKLTIAESDLAKAREALEPFASLAARYDDSPAAKIGDSVELWQIAENKGMSLRELALTVGHVRAARRALEGE